MIEPVTFTTHSYEKPKDGQMVWLLLAGLRTATPAKYNEQRGDGKPKYLKGEWYDLLGASEHRPIQGDSWSPLTPPQNANLKSGE